MILNVNIYKIIGYFICNNIIFDLTLDALLIFVYDLDICGSSSMWTFSTMYTFCFKEFQ